MLCRKLERNYIEENENDFQYNFLPYCFRNIGYQRPAWFDIVPPIPIRDILVFGMNNRM